MIKEMSGDYIQWLRGFYFVAKTGSFSLAGSQMGRHQTTISHQIRCLEDLYGVPLIDRAKSGCELTVEGKILYDKVISIFEIMKGMEDDIKNARESLEGQVVVAATHSMIFTYLPKFISNFQKDHPNVTFQLKSGLSSNIMSLVENSEADFGILHIEEVPSGFVYHDLLEAKLLLITPKKSAYTFSRQPTLREVSKLPFIVLSPNSAITPLIERTFSQKGIKLQTRIVTDSFAFVKKYVEIGLGVTIMEEFTVSEEEREFFETYSMERYFRNRRWGMIMRKTKYLPPQTQAFIHHLKPDIRLK